MEYIVQQLQYFVSTTKTNIPFLLWVVGILWGIHLLNWIFRYRLNIFGIYPRSVHGLVGIAGSPFLHGSINHLFLNTIPLFVFCNFLLIQGMSKFINVTVIIFVISGLGVWLVGRRAIHIGASGVIMGYWIFLIIQALYAPSLMSVMLAAMTVYYFGGLFLVLFPSRANVSWEGHLFGVIAGIIAIYLV